MHTYSLLKVTTADNIQLTGLALLGDKAKTAYIFIHGFLADFYSHPFYHTMAEQLSSLGHTIVLAHNRGTGVVSELLVEPNESIFLGSYYEKIEDAQLDITAYILELQKLGYTQFGLIGHSLGTIKVIRYLFEGDHAALIRKLILLAPFDKNAYMEKKIPGKLQQYVARAAEQVAAGNGRDIVPVPEFEDFAISYQTYVSWYQESDLNSVFDFYRPDNTFPTLQAITVPTLVVLGDNDEFITYPEFGVSPHMALEKMKQNMPNCTTVLLEQCDHNYWGHQDELATVVGEFVEK